MERERTAERVMERKYQFVYKRDSLSEAREIMIEECKLTLPVLDTSEELIGLLGERDIIKYQSDNILPRHAEHYTEVADVMRTDVCIISASTPLRDVCDVFTESEQRLIPILDNGNLLGVVESESLIRYFSLNWNQFVGHNEQ